MDLSTAQETGVEIHTRSHAAAAKGSECACVTAFTARKRVTWPRLAELQLQSAARFPPFTVIALFIYLFHSLFTYLHANFLL